jgi:hypothetical protein
MTQRILLIFTLFITCVLLLIGHLTDTPSHSISTLRSIAQSYCSHFPLFSILSSLLCCCAAPFDSIFPLSSVTHCSRDFIVLVTPIVVVTLLFSFTISLAL